MMQASQWQQGAKRRTHNSNWKQLLRYSNQILRLSLQAACDDVQVAPSLIATLRKWDAGGGQSTSMTGNICDSGLHSQRLFWK
jgi:hypothetical protein